MKLFYRQLLILTCFISLPVSVLYAQQGTNQYIPVSQHQTIESGTYWPAGQMLPHFATPASQLDGIDMKQGKLSSEEKTMLLAVQGIINKRQPRIFLYEHFSEGKHKWPRLLNLSVNELEATQYMRLVSKYKNELKGVILTIRAFKATKYPASRIGRPQKAALHQSHGNLRIHVRPVLEKVHAPSAHQPSAPTRLCTRLGSCIRSSYRVAGRT